MEKKEHTLFDFSAPDIHKKWMTINDGVMGGLSDSAWKRTGENKAAFQGTVSLEKDGGFCSTRAAIPPQALAGYQGIALRIRGDGKTYQLRLRDDDSHEHSYSFPFETTSATWITIQVPFSAFQAVYRGQLLEDVGPLHPSAMRSLGFLISDKQAGPFRLEVDWIRAYP